MNDSISFLLENDPVKLLKNPIVQEYIKSQRNIKKLIDGSKISIVDESKVVDETKTKVVDDSKTKVIDESKTKVIDESKTKVWNNMVTKLSKFDKLLPKRK
jgi:TPP-dependent pyruvate/acetoin dehydrogenase alpha subunit